MSSGGIGREGGRNIKFCNEHHLLLSLNFIAVTDDDTRAEVPPSLPPPDFGICSFLVVHGAEERGGGIWNALFLSSVPKHAHTLLRPAFFRTEEGNDPGKVR